MSRHDAMILGVVVAVVLVAILAFVWRRRDNKKSRGAGFADAIGEGLGDVFDIFPAIGRGLLAVLAAIFDFLTP